jgi:lycopene beta-cyclase
VLLAEKLTGRDIFTEIFQKNSPEKILAFLGNESTFLEDITIMTSLPIKPFLSSGIKQLLKKN